VSLREHRAVEETVRAELDAVRTQLAAACAAIADGESAQRELATTERKTSEGVYRKPADDRSADRAVKIQAARNATVQREKLRREESRLLVQLERTRRDIERAGVRRNVLPMLDDLPDATPCNLRWEEMNGDGDARVCPHCEASVFNVVALGPERAAALLVGQNAQKFHRRDDGTLLAGNCPRAVPAWKVYAGVAAALTMTVVAVVMLGHGSAPPNFAESPPVERPPWANNEPARTPHATDRLPRDHAFRAWVAVAPGDVDAVTISSSFTTLDGRTSLQARLHRHGGTFNADYTCSNREAVLSRTATLKSAVVEAMIGAAMSSPVTTTEEVCAHSDDYPKITVTVADKNAKVTTLRVKNCSHQWYHDATPLALDAGVETAYEALYKQLKVDACFADVKKAKPVDGREANDITELLDTR
jgi:hypothetical protein